MNLTALRSCVSIIATRGRNRMNNRTDKVLKEIENIVNELGCNNPDLIPEIIKDIQNGYNGDFHDYENKTHSYKDIRLKANNNVPDDDE